MRDLRPGGHGVHRRLVRGDGPSWTTRQYGLGDGTIALRFPDLPVAALARLTPEN
jgi:hypothetical protein